MSLRHQPKAALINDFSGFGRCSVTVALPIISQMKVQCCPVLTSVFSNHTGYPSFYFVDYTEKMPAYIAEWKKLNLHFECIAAGFLGSERQIEIVKNFIRDFKDETTKVLIDPVMGDYGKLYSTYTDEMCKEMQNLIKYADVLTPNLTELCRLLDLAYPSQTPSHEELHMLCKKLSLQGPKKIVITGLQRQGLIENFIFESDKPYSVIKVEKIGIDRSGTGDVFSSIVSASIVKSESLYSSVEKATTFISKCLKFTTELDLPENQGVCFEEFLTELK